jgi:hypothetical protein
LIYGLKTIFETKKIKIDYMNNANHIKTLEIKFALWLAPFFSPQGNVGSNFIVVKVVTFKRPNWPNLNLIFLFVFLLTLLSKMLSLHLSFIYENNAKIRSKLFFLGF